MSFDITDMKRFLMNRMKTKTDQSLPMVKVEVKKKILDPISRPTI